MITHARLLELLHYDPETGIFTWRVQRKHSKMRAGDVAGSNLGDLYRQITIDMEQYSVHRLAWFYVHGVWPTEDIDHRTDRANSIDNLREASSQQNRWNTRPKIGHSKWKGVTFDKGRRKCWKMAFKFPDGRIIQKRYEDEREAAEEWMFLALEHHGDFVRLH